MLNLILKDVLVLKKQALLALLYIPFMFIAFNGLGTSTFATGVVGFTYMMVMTACAYEDKNKTDVMMNSLPLKRSDIVLAKYLSVLVYLLMGTLVYLLFIGVLGIFDKDLIKDPLSAESIIGALGGAAFITGLYFPIFFKMGYVKSKIYNFVLFFAFFIGISTLANMMFNERMNLGKDIENFIAAIGEGSFILLLLLGMLIFMAVSYSLAVRFYKAREF